MHQIATIFNRRRRPLSGRYWRSIWPDQPHAAGAGSAASPRKSAL